MGETRESRPTFQNRLFSFKKTVRSKTKVAKISEGLKEAKKIQKTNPSCEERVSRRTMDWRIRNQMIYKRAWEKGRRKKKREEDA